MTIERLVTLAGAGLIASGVLVTIGFSVHPHDPLGTNHVMWIGSHVLLLAGFAAGLLGLVGLYGVGATGAGVTGLVGFLLASVSLMLYLGKLYWSGFIYPLVVRRHPDLIAEYGLDPGAHPSDPVVRVVFYLGPVLFGIGYTVLGWAVLKAGTFPPVPVRLVVAGALLVGLWPLLPAHVQQFSVIVSLVFTVGIA